MDQLRVVIFRDGDAWAAQCLEYDIGAQGSSVREVQDRLLVAIHAERDFTESQHGEAFKGISPAPPYIQRMWDAQAGTLGSTEKDYDAVQFALVA